jgi:hypothetical protein
VTVPSGATSWTFRNRVGSAAASGTLVYCANVPGASNGGTSWLSALISVTDVGAPAGGVTKVWARVAEVGEVQRGRGGIVVEVVLEPLLDHAAFGGEVAVRVAPGLPHRRGARGRGGGRRVEVADDVAVRVIGGTRRPCRGAGCVL